MMKINKFIFPSLVFITSSLIFVLSPIWSNDFRPNNIHQQQFVLAQVQAISAENILADPKVPSIMTGTQSLQVTLDASPNQSIAVENSLSRLHNTYLSAGDKFILLVRQRGEEVLYWVYNHDRAPAIYTMVALLIALVVAFGGWQGVNSLISLYFTGALIIGVLIPCLFAGWHPVILSLLLISLKVLVSFLLITGWNKKSVVSILGTILGLCAAGLCAQFFGEMANLNGLYLDKGEDLLYLGGQHQVQVRWLLFVAIMISALGAVMDVAISIASSYQELLEANPNQSVKDRMLATMRIGRDILGTMTNTLILAFAGSSLTTMMMIWGFQMPLEQFINIPAIGLSIIHGLAGSIGLTLTIPMTVLLCKWVYEEGQ
ncbi:YibE/F family protein [Vibrio tapetis]|uniref:YibE/F-like family protein n=1 Tax=Vibrio tapetis subsp. tapetis TaxID=1671868 RepID=A0A2N8ZK83_9VIBR|nr:YibE/F family protein [Vibrio tapetis]SON52319.1 YibE/F-like family protein [Vibrio tapetis subsp. tapetis]